VNSTLLAVYRNLKSNGGGIVGESSKQALREAKIILAFREEEENENVRLRVCHELDNYFDVYGDPDGYVNAQGKHVSAEKERAEIERQIERCGCMLVVSEYKDDEGDWQIADSIGMCIYEDPTDPFQNCYVPELMAQALDKFRGV